MIRCGRTQFGQAIWTKANPASVTAMAGMVRRISSPAVTPSAKANAAYPIGTMPWAPNRGGAILAMLSESDRAAAAAW